MHCLNCGDSPGFPHMATLYHEYRVGSVDSPDRFHLCPGCNRENDPIGLWSQTADVHPVSQ